MSRIPLSLSPLQVSVKFYPAASPVSLLRMRTARPMERNKGAVLARRAVFAHPMFNLVNQDSCHRQFSGNLLNCNRFQRTISHRFYLLPLLTACCAYKKGKVWTLSIVASSTGCIANPPEDPGDRIVRGTL